MTYRLARAFRGWPNIDYTLTDILRRARKEGRQVRDGYGRLRIRHARKLKVSGGIVFVAVAGPENPALAWGPTTKLPDAPA